MQWYRKGFYLVYVNLTLFFFYPWAVLIIVAWHDLFRIKVLLGVSYGDEFPRYIPSSGLLARFWSYSVIFASTLGFDISY